jgi:hypothetical protein
MSAKDILGTIITIIMGVLALSAFVIMIGFFILLGWLLHGSAFPS